MYVRLQLYSFVRHPSRGGFVARAFGLVGHGDAAAMGREVGQPGYQCGFGQALQIDNEVIADLT